MIDKSFFYVVKSVWLLHESKYFPYRRLHTYTHRTNELSTIILLLQPTAAVGALARFFLLLSVSYMLAFRASLSPNTEKVLNGSAREVGTGWTRRPERAL